MNDLVKAILPTIANALIPGAGVAVSIAEQFLAKKMGIPQDQVQSTLAGMQPADLIKMKELDNELAGHLADNGIALQMGQINTNIEEAKSTSVFVAGWRPYIGWIGGTGIGYQFLLHPLFNGLSHLFGVVGDPFPTLEVQDLIALVTTLLGSSILRSQDKARGVASGE